MRNIIIKNHIHRKNVQFQPTSLPETRKRKCGNGRKLVSGIRNVTLLREKYRGIDTYGEAGLERNLDGATVQTYIDTNEACLQK